MRRSRYGRTSTVYLFAARREEIRYSLLKTKNFFIIRFFLLLVSSIVLAATPKPPPFSNGATTSGRSHQPSPILQNFPTFLQLQGNQLGKTSIKFLCARSFMFLGEETIGERLYRPTLLLGILLGTTSLRNKVAEWQYICISEMFSMLFFHNSLVLVFKCTADMCLSYRSHSYRNIRLSFLVGLRTYQHPYTCTLDGVVSIE